MQNLSALWLLQSSFGLLRSLAARRYGRRLFPAARAMFSLTVLDSFG
jgi:hypothetical protein